MDQQSASVTRPIMQARGLRKAFGAHVILDGVSLNLYEGEVVLLRGDNGAGKTTLLNILTGNLEPDSGSIRLDVDDSEEDFQFPFRWWQEINPLNHFTSERVANEGVGRTWQDIRLFETASLLDNIAVARPSQPGENPLKALICNGVVQRSERANRHACEKLLEKIGLKGREESSADRISLGQAKRVAIARAIRAGARILFLDEPLSSLDSDGIEEILALLTDLALRDRITLVIVEHVFNIPRILDLAQTVWTLRNGTIQVETTRSVTKGADMEADRVMKELLDQLALSEGKVQEQALDGGAKLFRISRLDSQERSDVPILEVCSVAIQRNERFVIGRQSVEGTVHGLSFRLYEGDVAVLSAPNGWGKTTLFEALGGFIPIAHGRMLLRGVDMVRAPSWKRSQFGLRTIAAQTELFPSLSVSEFLAISRQSLPQSDRFPSPKRLIGELSGGERRQLALTDLSLPGSLVMLDEPFLGLDSEAVASTGKRLRNFMSNLSGTLLIALPRHQ